MENPERNAGSENSPPAQSWTAEAQFAVVLEAAGLSEIELSEYCRRKGLYLEQIKAWRQACINGQKADKAQQKDDREQTRKDKKRIQELERELRRKDKALAETAALLVLRKSSTITGGSTTRTTDRLAGTAVTSDLVE